MYSDDKKSLTVLSLFFFTLPLCADLVDHVPYSSSWNYFKGTQEASTPVSAWRTLDFDDASWLNGQAPFGYDANDPIDFGTEITDMRGEYSTLFLRRSFTVADPASVQTLLADVFYDDGFIVWINGSQVLARYPPASVVFDALASDVIEPDEETGLELEGDPQEYLVSGENIVAVQVFNGSITSSDLVFDIHLYDPLGTDETPPELYTVAPSPGSTLRSLSSIKVTFTEEVTDVDAADLLVNGTAATDVNGSGAGPYQFSFSDVPEGEITASWNPDHGITDTSPAAHPFAGSDWSFTIDPDAPLADIAITEIMASNATTLEAEEDEFPDWLELCNRGAETVNLEGWSLSDDPLVPAKWVFPAKSLDPGVFLVVFASDKNCIPGEAGCSFFHTNFKLNREGEFLGLYSPAPASELVYAYSPRFPEQHQDFSYGIAGDGTLHYFGNPTPGFENDDTSLFAIEDFTEDPVFSVEHGIFDAPFELALSCETPGADIYYTTEPEGREPTPASGALYTGPFTVYGSNGRGVVTVRAVAVLEGGIPSSVVTATYIFPGFVLAQPNDPDGFPLGNAWGDDGVDYELDQRITESAEYQETAFTALRTVPSISIVADIDDLFGSSRGIYSHPSYEGIQWERAASAEMIYPDGSKGFQVNCGIRIQGGSSTSGWKSDKVSMRLLFKDDYGPSKLRFPLFRDSPVKTFDTLVLDAHLNLTWNHPDHGQRVRSQYVRDQYCSDLQNLMGSYAPYGMFVNLYINGLHWGLYGLHERSDTAFAAEHLGGNKEDYDLFKHDGSQCMEGCDQGAQQIWNTMENLAEDGLSSNTDYEAIQEYLDVADLCDYMIMNIFAGNDDWPRHNWYAARNRVIPGSQFKFFSWDAEHVLKSTTINQVNVNNDRSPAELFQQLRDNAEFRLLFADHVHKHFFNGGILYVDGDDPQWDPAHPDRNRPAELYMKRIDEIDALIVMESARWGDNERPDDPYERNDEWMDELAWLLDDYFPIRSHTVLQQFKSAGLYPDIEAPVFNRHGGTVEQGWELHITNPNGSGTVYYTINGDDPREYGTGDASSAAMQYTGSQEINETTHVKARIKSGSSWSALNEAVFRTRKDYEALAVTEIMYHPPASEQHPLVNADLFEFFELHNTGTETIDLSGMQFTRGISYTFPEGFLLPAGGYAVLAANLDMFSSRYPFCTPGGVYEGRLDNDFDRVTFVDADGETVFSFTYCDAAYWPREPDGGGFSLVPADEPESEDLNDPANWTSGKHYLGTPGAGEDDTPDAPRFMRGDANGDARVDISDAISMLLFLFAGKNTSCKDALDTNNDNMLDIADPVALLAYLFAGGAQPAAPFSYCGVDPDGQDSLGCASYTPCGTK